MDFTGRLIAGVLALILVILFPLQYIAQSNSENIDYLVDERTKSLSDSIRSRGYLDTAMYEEYVNFLDTTGELYDMEIEDIHPVTGDETSLSEASNDAYKEVSLKNCDSTNTVNNRKISSLNNRSTYNPVTFLLNNAGDNLLSVKSVNKRVDNFIKVLSIHTHMDSCYAGHRHAESGCPYILAYSGAMPSLTGYQNYGSYGYMDQRTILNIYYCAACKNAVATAVHSDYMNDSINYRWNGDSISLTQYYLDSNNSITSRRVDVPMFLVRTTYAEGWTQMTGDGEVWYRKLNPEWQTAYNNFYGSIVTYYGGTPQVNMSKLIALGFDTSFSCPYCLQAGRISKTVYKKYTCGLEQDETPICNTVVTSITPTNPNQTIIQGGSIVTNATATMLDGSTKTVNCTASAFDNNTPGMYTVTLTYSGLVGNAKSTGTRTCTMTVTVNSARTLSSVAASPGTQTISRLGTPVFSVTAYYSDGASKALSTGQYSISGFNSSVLGAQTVTLTYTENGITKSAAVTVCVDGLTSISVNPTALTVERYTDVSALSFTITATYLYGSNRIITSGYVVSGYSPSVIGQQKVTVSYTENGITKGFPVTVNVTVLHKVCPHCSNTYNLNTDDSDPGCPFCGQLIREITVTPDYVEVAQGESLPVTVQAVHNDGTIGVVNGWTSNYDPNKTGLQLVTIEYGGFAADISVWVEETKITCPVCGTQYPASEGRCPVCAANVVSITASPTTITVNQDEPINLTVTAYFEDGNSSVVTDWIIDRTSSEPGTFTAKVSYKNASATITLTVIAVTSVVCPICGLVYDPAQNPKGCPVCSAFITGIEAYMTTGSNLIQYGSDPGIAVILIFRDTHRELTSEGYTLENYDAHTLGAQMVTVLYDTFSTAIEIIVVNTLSSITCPNGHVYYRNEDGSDPGCPYCALSENPETVSYFDITYFTEIIDKVYTDGIYYFDKGNFVTVLVTKKNASVLTKMQNMFFKTSMLGRIKRYIYGGEVQ